MRMTLKESGVFLAVILLGFVSSACAATGQALSQERTNELANLSIQEFLKQRFVDAVLPFGREKHVESDGSVTLDAQYTDVNTAQLYRPGIELRRFCRAQQGQWTVERVDFSRERYDREVERRRGHEKRFCADPQNAPSSADNDKQGMDVPTESAIQTRNFVTTPQGTFALTPGATVEQCIDAQEQSREYRMRDFPRSTPAEASAPEDVGGRFSCNQPPQAKYPGWSVTITPVDFEQGESGTLKANRLTLLISP